jgi:uncharacterized protein YbjT (DUF2867 family)
VITIMGASGHTGGAAAAALLQEGEKVRLIARSRERVQELADGGAEVVLGDAADVRFLADAFRSSEAVFTLIPQHLSHPDYPAYQDQFGEATVQAIRAAGVKHAVFLSSLGADQPSGTGPIAGLHRQEKRLAGIAGLNLLVLRPAYFFENYFTALPLIKQQGINGSAMAGDHAFPQIATADIAAVAAQALGARDFQGVVVRELLGPRDLTLTEGTRILGGAIGKPDLKYVQFPYEAALEAMIGGGLSKSVASAYVEMSRALNEGIVRSLQGRTDRTTTPTRFEDYAQRVLAPAYRAM